MVTCYYCIVLYVPVVAAVTGEDLVRGELEEGAQLLLSRGRGPPAACPGQQPAQRAGTILLCHSVLRYSRERPRGPQQPRPHGPLREAGRGGAEGGQADVELPLGPGQTPASGHQAAALQAR